MRTPGLSLLLLGVTIQTGCGPTPPAQPAAVVASADSQPADAGATGAGTKRIVNTAYESWAGFQPGTAVTYKSVTTEGGKTLATTTVTHTLNARTDDLVTIDLRTVAAGHGGTETVTTDQFKNPKWVTVPATSEDEKYGRPAGRLGKGRETVTALEQDFATEWFKDHGRTEAGKTLFQFWLCDKVPSGLVKSVIRTDIAHGPTTTTELVEIKLP